jgi:hypothetical protein
MAALSVYVQAARRQHVPDMELARAAVDPGEGAPAQSPAADIMPADDAIGGDDGPKGEADGGPEIPIEAMVEALKKMPLYRNQVRVHHVGRQRLSVLFCYCKSRDLDGARGSIRREAE